MRAGVPVLGGITTRGTKHHRQKKHLFRLRSLAISRSAQRSPAGIPLGTARSSLTIDQVQATNASGVYGEGLHCRRRGVVFGGSAVRYLPRSFVKVTEPPGSRSISRTTQGCRVHELPVLANRCDCGRNSRPQLPRAPVTGRASRSDHRKPGTPDSAVSWPADDARG